YGYAWYGSAVRGCMRLLWQTKSRSTTFSGKLTQTISLLDAYTASNLLSTVGPSRAFSDGELLYPDPSKYALPDDPSMPYLEDIYASPSEVIFTDSSCDDEGVVTDFNNLETTVWILVDLPFGKKAIRTKWVYMNKKDERSVVVRNKARLVAQGHWQEEGIDYNEVFALMARIEAIRIFLAFASYMGCIVYQMDMKSAFLYGTINKEVYMSQPPGFVDPKFPNKVHKVVKALYGLHQASKAWYATLSTFLEQNGYIKGAIDKTLFIKKDKKDIMLVQVYVDDIIFDLESLWKLVKERFEKTEPKNYTDDYLLKTLKTMFEQPDVEASVWRDHKGRLEVEEESEMSLELLRLVRRQLNEGGGLLGIMDFNILLLLFILSVAAWNYCCVVASTPIPVITIPKTANEFAIKAYQLLEDKVLLKLDWAKNHKMKSSLKKTIAFADKGSSNFDTDKIMERMDAMTIKMDAQYKELQSRAKQSTPDLDDDNMPMSHEEEAKFMQAFGRLQSTNAFIKETFMDLKNQLETIAKNHQASIQNLETKFDRIADKQSGRPSGSLPSNTQPNPRGSKAYQPPQARNDHVNAVFTKVKQLSLGVGTERMIININSEMKHSYSNDDTCFSIDVILEEDFDALLDEGSKILYSIRGTILKEEIFFEFDEFMAMAADENFESE
nr:putative ribonuclease H-like domain-containing protein [Tanacetum cinerariifolium]